VVQVANGLGDWNRLLVLDLWRQDADTELQGRIYACRALKADFSRRMSTNWMIGTNRTTAN